MSSSQYNDSLSSGLRPDPENTNIHSGHVSTGSQLVSEGGQFTGVDMAAETAKFDNAYGAVNTHTHSSTGQYQYGQAGQTAGQTGQYAGEATGQTGSYAGQSAEYSNQSATSGLTGGHSSHTGTQGLTGEHSSHTGTGAHDSSFQQSSGGAYQGSTAHQHSSHGGHHSGTSGSDSYTGDKEQQRTQMQEEKKESANQKKEELKERNASGESKTQIAKDEHNKVAHQADKETPDGHKPSLMEKVKTAVKNL